MWRVSVESVFSLFSCMMNLISAENGVLLNFTLKVKMFCWKSYIFSIFPLSYAHFFFIVFLTIVYKKSEHTSGCFLDFELNYSFSFTLCADEKHRSLFLWLIHTCILYWSKHQCSLLQWDSSSPAAQTWGCIWKRKYSPGALRELGMSST